MNDRDTIVILDQASGYLQIDMLEAFKKKYAKQVIIAGSITERATKLDNQIVWHKIIKYNRSSTFKRLYTWSIATLQMYFYILTKYRGAHLFIITNPPFAIFIPLFLRNNYSLLIYDIYPDALVQYNILKEKSFIVKFWKTLNSKVFLKANRIFTISEGMSELISSYVPKNKIEVVPIWTDAEFLKPLPKDENLFLKKLDLSGKFLIQYSGNLGRTHDVEVLVELANEFKDNSNVFFLIIGEGNKKKIIEEKIKEYQLTNCLLLPWQPVEMIPYSLSAPDLGVVTIGSEASNLSVPSKTFNLMSVQVPILAIADKDSELARIILKYSIGNAFSKNQLREMKEYILNLVNNPDKLIKLKENALTASKDFTKENANFFL